MFPKQSAQISALLFEYLLDLRYLDVAHEATVLHAYGSGHARGVTGDKANWYQPEDFVHFRFGGNTASGDEDVIDRFMDGSPGMGNHVKLRLVSLDPLKVHPYHGDVFVQLLLATLE